MDLDRNWMIVIVVVALVLGATEIANNLSNCQCPDVEQTTDAVG